MTFHDENGESNLNSNSNKPNSIEFQPQQKNSQLEPKLEQQKQQPEAAISFLGALKIPVKILRYF